MINYNDKKDIVLPAKRQIGLKREFPNESLQQAESNKKLTVKEID